MLEGEAGVPQIRQPSPSGHQNTEPVQQEATHDEEAPSVSRADAAGSSMGVSNGIDGAPAPDRDVPPEALGDRQHVRQGRRLQMSICSLRNFS